MLVDRLLEKNLPIDDKILLTTYKISCLSLVAGRENEAEPLFLDAYKAYFEKKSESLIGLLMICPDFFKGKKSLGYLYEAYKIAKEMDSKSLVAKLLNNIGYEHLRIGEHEKAYQSICRSNMLFKFINPNNRAYALNNIALYFLVKGNAEEAFKQLQAASLLDIEEYLKIVLLVNKFITKLHINSDSEREENKTISHKLLDYLRIKNVTDSRFYRKIYSTHYYYYLLNNNLKKANYYLNEYNKYKRDEIGVSVLIKPLPTWEIEPLIPLYGWGIIFAP